MSQIELMARAFEARQRAYAPYSKFSVGAALETDAGEIFLGCNIENISLGLTNCAERVAVAGAIVAGKTHFKMLAIAGDADAPVVPCGACRQVLAEFNPDLRIVSATVNGKTAEFFLSELLPRPRQGILNRHV